MDLAKRLNPMYIVTYFYKYLQKFSQANVLLKTMAKDLI